MEAELAYLMMVDKKFDRFDVSHYRSFSGETWFNLIQPINQCLNGVLEHSMEQESVFQLTLPGTNKINSCH